MCLYDCVYLCTHTRFNASITLKITTQKIETEEVSPKKKRKGNKEVLRKPKQRIEIKELFSSVGFVWEVIPQKEYQYVSIIAYHYMTFITFFCCSLTFVINFYVIVIVTFLNYCSVFFRRFAFVKYTCKQDAENVWIMLCKLDAICSSTSYFSHLTIYWFSFIIYFPFPGHQEVQW